MIKVISILKPRLVGVIILTLASCFFFSKAQAAVITWDNTSGDGLWSTCTNWVGDACPTGSDVATFDGTSDTASSIDFGFSNNVAGIDIKAGYTNTVTNDKPAGITVGSTGIAIASGAFNGGSSTIDLNGGFTMTGGTFTSTSSTMNISGTMNTSVGGSFVHNNGTVNFDGNAQSIDVSTSIDFQNFIRYGGSAQTLTITAGDTINIQGDLTLTDGVIDGSSATINVQGNLSAGVNYDGNNTTVITFTGSAATQNFSNSTVAGFRHAIVVAKSSGSVVLTGGMTMTRTLAINSGTFDLSGYDFTIGGAITQSGGTFSGGSGTIDINAAFTQSGGIFNASSGITKFGAGFDNSAGGTFEHNNGTVQLDSNTATLNFNISESFYDLERVGGAAQVLTISGSDVLVVENDLTLTEGSFGGTTAIIEVYGDVMAGSGYDGNNTVTLKFTGTAATQNFTSNVSPFRHTVAIDKASGTVAMATNLYLTRNFTIDNGTFDLQNHTLQADAAYQQNGGTFNGGNNSLDFNSTFTMTGGTFNATSGAMNIGAAFDISAGGSFVHNSGSVVFDGNTYTINVNSSLTLNNLQFAGSSGTIKTISAGDTLVSVGTLTLTDSEMNTGTLEAQGNVYVASTLDNGSFLLNFRGSETQYFTFGAGANSVFNRDINVNKSGGRVLVVMDSGTLTLDQGSQDLVIDGGIFDINGYSLAVSGASGTFIVNSGGTLALDGSEVVTTPTINAGSTIEYSGTGGPYTLQNWSYKSLTIAGGVSSVFSLPGTKNVGETLTISSGILDAADFGMDISGNTVISGGTLMTGTGAIVFGNEVGDTVTISSGELQIESDDTSTDISITAGTWTNSGGTITYIAATGITGALLSSISPYYNLTVNSSGSTYVLNGAIVVSNDITITAGTLGVSVSQYGISVGGSWIDTGAGTFTEGSGTVTFTGSGSINANESFYTVTLNASGTYLLDNNLTIGRTLNLTAGTLDVSGSNYTVTVARNWARTSGDFNARAGTVIFNDATQTSTISGSTTFYSVTCTTASKNLTFTAGTTQTVGGVLTLTGGGVGTEVTLQSSTTSAWFLNVSGTSSVDYVSVSYSDASGGNAITHAVSPARSVDGGNNVNWSFNVAPTVATITVAQGTDGTGDVTITFIMDDADDDDTLQAKIEYSVNGGGAWADPTISTTGSETSATHGDPNVDNAQTYQIGQSGAYITSSSGANTVTIIWEAATDVDAATDISNAQIRVTPYDGTEAGTAGTSSNFILDVVSPTGLASPSYGTVSTANALIRWTAASDTNFDRYELWYASSSSDASSRTGSAVEWDNGDDANLTTDSTASTTITANIKNKYVSIFAVDAYGNTVSTTQLLIPNFGGGGSSSSSTTSSSTSTSTSYSITITSPVAGDSYEVGDTIQITWTQSGLSSSYLDIYYSKDGGDFEKIVSNKSASAGSYSWQPSFESNDVLVKLNATDLASVLATDTSDAFSIAVTESSQEPVDDSGSECTQNCPTLESSGEQGYSPFSGKLEDISKVKTGMFIKGTSYNTVYYIDDQMRRRPFLDAQTYFTWANSFSEVEIVTDATLPTLALARPMLPKAEVVLIKIESDPKVYAVEDGDTLRWITNEYAARDIYGDNWADYVIDVAPTLMPYFYHGENINVVADSDANTALIKSRIALATMAGLKSKN